MFKLLLTAAIIAGIYFFFIKKPQVTEHRRKKAEEATRKRPETRCEEEDTMVPCAKCGTYVATDEAIIKDGRYYCSKSCAGVK